MDFHPLQLIFMLVVLSCCHSGQCCKPLHLTPLIDEGNITAALELSEVKDPHLIIPKSYAGFITTDREQRNHLFFWFLPSINNTEAPLVVWLNGGPTVSSMFGLLYENGSIRPKTLNNDNIVYEQRPNSWAEPFSMLYIDNPVGVGYSYSESNSFKTTQDEYSEELYLFIEQFYLMFPQYLHRELYLGGQSYAGKYIPAFAHRIHTKILENKSGIPLTGIYLGGPYFDPLTQSAEFCEYYYAMGAIARSQLVKCKRKVLKLSDLVKGGDLENETVDSLFRRVFSFFLPERFDNYAISKIPYYDLVEKLMKTDIMREVLHVCDLNYKTMNYNLRRKFKSDLLVSTKTKMVDLLNNYKVLLYTGDYDGIITSPMVEAALMTTPWSHQEQYNNSYRKGWEVGNDLRGFYTKIGQFCRVVVHGAGHQTPHDQPESTRDMMIQFVQHGCIQENV